MSSSFSAVKKHFLTFATGPIKFTLPIFFVLSFVLNFVLEIIGRKSLVEAFKFLLSEPFLYLCNTLIILFTLSLCLLIRWRITLLLVLVGGWLTLGITNGIVLSYRSSPLSAIDFLIAKAALGMFSLYLSALHTVLLIILIAAFIALLVFLFIKCPRCRVSYKKSLSCILIIGLAVCGAFSLTTNISATEYESGELLEAYNDYGFAYCFTRSLISQGVERPSDYPSEELEEFIDSIEPDPNEPTNTKLMPNIVFVQLESFFDVSHIKGLVCSEDPTPNFTRLKNEGVSGYLRVTNFGGGTANTEFEVLTGMNLDHFGFGEYPYTTVLNSRACESIAYNLKPLDYSTHAIHNHNAVFYDRNVVYPNLGFDTFTPIELMRNVTRNPLGWAHDSVLTGEIISALNYSDKPDFVFAVSVQGHGKYPDEPIDSDGETPGNSFISAEADEIDIVSIADEEYRGQYQYYINQLHEMDSFIGDLITELDNREEPTVVVFYGDHLPSLELTEDDITNGDLFETEYAVWSNFSLPAVNDGNANEHDRNLEAYRLSAYIQTLLDLEEGYITRLHQTEFESNEDYNDMLTMLEYSQLYDKRKSPYKTIDMSIGTRLPKITSYTMSDNTLYVYGEGFNEYSSVKIGGFVRSTQFINENKLAVENAIFAIGDVNVLQISEDGTVLCSAEKVE